MFKMANLLNKDPFTYEEERKGFLQDLQQFHRERRTPFDCVPELGGREVDLYLLYRRVIELGGWQKVTDELRWEDLMTEFRIPRACPNGEQALKTIYIRFLDKYEKVNFLGEDPDENELEDDDGPPRKKASTPLHRVPMVYKYHHHQIPENMRSAAGLSTNLVKLSCYEKLERSLQSGLPNEVDFAFNVCVLLSSETKHVLNLAKSRLMLDLLLAHVGIFTEGGGSYENVYQEAWTQLSGRDYLRFWYETVKDERARQYLRLNGNVYTRRDRVGEEVLNLGQDLGADNKEGHRVTQLAHLLRNLSFEDMNKPVMAASTGMFKFLMLCIHCSFGDLRQLALDTLANISIKFMLTTQESGAYLLAQVKTFLKSADKFEVVRALEIISRLCQLEENETTLAEDLEAQTYELICRLLCVGDIQLIVFTLEALYQLSELGEATTTGIAAVPHAVDTLVDLTTVEAQSYGPQSLQGIKVVEYVPPPEEVAPSHPSMPSPHMLHSAHHVAGKPQYMSALTKTLVQSPLAGRSPLDNEVPRPTDRESTTCNWLQATYELKAGVQVSQTELYSDYLQCCRRYNIADILPSGDFLHLVRVVFPQAEVSSVERPTKDRETIFTGLGKRDRPRPFSVVHQVSAPSVTVGTSPVSGSLPTSAANSPRLDLTHTPTLRRRLMEPPRLSPQHILHTGSTPQASPLARSLAPSPAPPGARPPTPKSSKSFKAKAPVSIAPALNPGRPEAGIQVMIRPSGASPQPLAPLGVAGTPQAAGIRVSSVLQKQLQNPPSVSSLSACQSVTVSLPASTALAPQVSTQRPILTASTPTIAPSLKCFPSIQQALQTDHGLARMTVGNAAFLDDGNARSSDSNLIKSLLAKKVSQNMVGRQILPRPSTPQLGGDMELPSGEVMAQLAFASVASDGASSIPTTLQFVMASSDNNPTPQPIMVSMGQPGIQPVTFSQQTQIHIQQQPLQQVQALPQVSQVQPVQQLQPTQPVAAMQQVQAVVSGHQVQQIQGAPPVQTMQQPIQIVQQQLLKHPIQPQQPQLQQVLQQSGQQQQAQQLLQPQQQQPEQQQQQQPQHQFLQQQIQHQLLLQQQQQQQQALQKQMLQQQLLQQQFLQQQLQQQQPQLQQPLATAIVAKKAPSSAHPSSVAASVIPAPSSPRPRGVELEVCGEAEKAKDVVNSGAEARIERVENRCTPQWDANIRRLAASPSSVPAQPSTLTAAAGAPPAPSTVLAASSSSHVSISQTGALVTSTPGAPSNHTTTPHPAASMPIRPQSHLHLQPQLQSQPQPQLQPLPAPMNCVRQIIPNLADPNSVLSVQVTVAMPENTSANGTDVQWQQNLVQSREEPMEVDGGGNQSAASAVVQNGSMGSPLKAEEELPPSPVCEGRTGGQGLQERVAVNGVSSAGDQGELKVLAPEQIAKLLVKASKLNGIGHHGDCGGPLESAPGSQIHGQNQSVSPGPRLDRRVPEAGEATAGLGPGQQQQPNRVLGQIVLGGQGAAKENGITVVIHTSQPHLQPGASLGLPCLPSRTLASDAGAVGGQAVAMGAVVDQSAGKVNLGVCESSRDSEVSSDSTTSSTTDSVGDKHSSCPTPSLPNPPTPKKAGGKGEKGFSTCQGGKAKVPPPVTAPSPSTRKRTRAAAASESQPPRPANPNQMEYLCEWDGCKRCFENARSALLHVANTHLQQYQGSLCLWEGCDPVHRKRWSLFTHVQDHHCSEMGMRAAHHRRINPPAAPPPLQQQHQQQQQQPQQQQQLQVQQPSVPPTSQATAQAPLPPPPPPPPPHTTPHGAPNSLVYPQDAALQAIKRFSIRPPYPEFSEPREGPVTKHIRLTSALILRNLARFSPLGRSLIKRREQLLSYVAMSGVEASNALSNCLWEIMHDT